MLYEVNTEAKKKKESIPSLQEDNELPWAMYKHIKTRNEEEEEEAEKNENESDESSEDDKDDKYGNSKKICFKLNDFSKTVLNICRLKSIWKLLFLFFCAFVFFY